MIILILSFLAALIAIGLFKNKKWKHLCILGIFPTVSYLIYVVVTFFYMRDMGRVKHYPTEALGTTIFNWLDEFFLNIGMIFVAPSPFLLIGAVLFVISIFKIKEREKNNAKQ